MTGSKQIQLAPAVLSSTEDTPDLKNDDQKFWWGVAAASFVRLMDNCKYSKDHQLSYLNWFYRWIIPALGPRPGKNPKLKSILVMDNSALEFSINWKEKKAQKTVRFTIEPTSYEAGTAEDPLNQQEATRLMKALASEFPGVDARLFDLYAAETFLSNEEYANLKDKPENPFRGTWIAFDLVGGKISVKAYFIPALKSLSTGVTPKELIFNGIRKWDGGRGNYDTSIGILDSYLQSFPGANEFFFFSNPERPAVTMVAFDCVDSADARIKVYFETKGTSLAKAKSGYTLGGRLEGEDIDEGLVALGELWSALFGPVGEDEGMFTPEPGCVYAVEMKPGQEQPETKIYIGAMNTGKSDKEVGDALATWFTKRGQPEMGEGYYEKLCATFPKHLSGKGTHTWISFSYTKKTGVYLTTYYSPQIVKVHTDTE